MSALGQKRTLMRLKPMSALPPKADIAERDRHVMRKVIRGYGKDKNLNLILIGTIPVPHSKDKRSPAARQDKRYLVRQGATIFKKETIHAPDLG